MRIIKLCLTIAIVWLPCLFVSAQIDMADDGFNQSDMTQYANSGLNRSGKDSTNVKKKIPKGLKVWTVDTFGERTDAIPDTVPHLYPNSIFTNGLYGEYNNLGNVGSPRVNRIFTDKYAGDDFIFIYPYDFFITNPTEFHFTNTLSPITNISYNTCGSGQYGEDRFKANFATNAGKRIGGGLKIDYIYGKGYYQNAATAHFGTSLYGSYIGDRYQAHAIATWNHQKVAENGGITNDEMILHPSSFNDNYQASEIPTVLSYNWNRNDNQSFFLTHRYSFGFNRKVKMTDEEIEAKKFAQASKKLNDTIPESEQQPADTLWLKDEYVPVTSVIHTLNFQNYDRIYQASHTPTDFYRNTFIEQYADGGYGGQYIYDETKHICLRNDLALALLEGFNKWVPMGLKLFAAHQYKRFTLPGIDVKEEVFTENHITIGGVLQKSLGQMLHYKVQLESYVVGPNFGDLLLDGEGDINFPLFKDTVSLSAKAFMHREAPAFYYGNYQSKHLWWSNDLDVQTHSHIEGLLDIGKTKTKLRLAIDNFDRLAYFSYSYDIDDNFNRKNAEVNVEQSGNESLITLQLMQNFTLGPLNLETQLTLQKSSNMNVMPVPSFNAYANLYLKFKIAKVLATELGADVRYFTKYTAPDYSPYIGQFCVQGNGDKNVKVGDYPIINVYANCHLKHARFFVMMSHVNSTAGNYFLAPHYPQNVSTFRFGVSWNFFN